MFRFDGFQSFPSNKENQNSPHQEKCRQMFDDIMSGHPIFMRLDQDLEDYRNQEILTQDMWFSMSILSEEIIEYDEQIVDGRKKLSPDYRPYFISFLFQADQIPHIINHFPTNQWLTAEFHLDFSDDLLEHTHPHTSINGYLLTSASPSFIRSGKILKIHTMTKHEEDLVTKHVTRLNNRLKKAVKKSVQKEFSYIWHNNPIEYIDCYNVGCGNSDHIQCGKRNILYDIGCEFIHSAQYTNSRTGTTSDRFPASSTIRHLNPDGIILSHWDMDHILGCAFAEQELFCTIWIAPDLPVNACLSALRLARYIQLVGILCLSKWPQNGPIRLARAYAGASTVNLYQGAGTDSKVTPANRNGLFLDFEIRMKENDSPTKVLLAGDVPYNCMPSKILHNTAKYHYLHVPHHCRDMDLSNLTNINNTKGICAIISDYRDTTLDGLHNKAHYDELVKRFQNVVWTTSPANSPELNSTSSTRAIRINFRRNPGWKFRG